MHELTKDEQRVVDSAVRFGETVIGPNAQIWEKLGRIPADVFEHAAEAGLCRLLVPVELGGLALSVSAIGNRHAHTGGTLFFFHLFSGGA